MCVRSFQPFAIDLSDINRIGLRGGQKKSKREKMGMGMGIGVGVFVLSLSPSLSLRSIDMWENDAAKHSS